MIEGCHDLLGQGEAGAMPLQSRRCEEVRKGFVKENMWQTVLKAAKRLRMRILILV